VLGLTTRLVAQMSVLGPKVVVAKTIFPRVRESVYMDLDTSLPHSLANVKGIPLRDRRVTHLKRKFSKTSFVLVTNVFSVSKLIVWYLYVPLSTWQLGLKLE